MIRSSTSVPWRALAVFVLVASAPRSSSAQGTIKVMDWNIHHGVDTSGANNLERVAAWIVRIDPQVVSLNEVEKQNGYNDNADEPAVLESLLESRTGAAWHSCFAQRTGSARGQGNLLLSRLPIEACGHCLLSASRSVAVARMRFNGGPVHVFSTHLDDASASTRTTQIAELKACAAARSEQRVIMGDFNASPTATELRAMTADYEDAWARARADGTAVAYSGNEAGNTRNGRIDYIWRSKGATGLVLLGAQVYDTGSISDHRPLSATYAPTVSPAPPPVLPPANVRVVR